MLGAARWQHPQTVSFLSLHLPVCQFFLTPFPVEETLPGGKGGACSSLGFFWPGQLQGFHGSLESSITPQHWDTRDHGFGPIPQPEQFVTETSYCCTGFWWHGMTGGWVPRAGGSIPSMATCVLQGPGATSMSQVLPFPPSILRKNSHSP